MTEAEFIKSIANAIAVSKTPENAAKAVYNLCYEAAKAEGQNPAREVAIYKPGEPRHFDDASCWAVAWEAGPYEWAVIASLQQDTGRPVVAEPYYSFDLCFHAFR